MSNSYQIIRIHPLGIRNISAKSHVKPVVEVVNYKPNMSKSGSLHKQVCADLKCKKLQGSNVEIFYSGGEKGAARLLKTDANQRKDLRCTWCFLFLKIIHELQDMTENCK